MFYWLEKNQLHFPPANQTHHSGIIALGGDLSAERLKLAYAQGIFPWYDKDEPIVWWCPDPRMVLFPEELKVSKSMRKLIRNQHFTVTYNQNFNQVIQLCSQIKRPNQKSTWIHPEIQESYNLLHQIGLAKSVEVWQNNQLVGGLYGVEVNGVFSGESMFSKASNASKFGFIKFVQQFKGKLIDCQVHTEHLASLGAKLIPRKAYLQILASK